MNYTGAAAQTVNATTYATLNFSGAGVKTNSGTVTVNTALTGTALTNAATGVLNIGGTSTITTLTATAVGNVVNYTGGAAQTVKATTYDTLNFSGAGVKTNSGTVTVNAALTGTALTNAATGVLNIAGASTITTLTATAVGNVVNYTGAAAQTVNATTYATLNFSGAGVKTNSGTVTVNAALTGTALTNAASGVLNLAFAAAPTITTLDATAVGNTVNYSLGGAQSVKATTYHHLGLATSGAKTAAAGLTVNGNLTTSGTATFTTGAFTHNFGSWVINSTAATPITATGSTLNFNTPAPAAATSITGTTAATLALAVVNINNTSGVSSTENLSATGNFTVAANATFSPAATVIVSGTGTLTGSGTVQVTRTAAVAGFSQQYTITNKTLTNLTVEYIGGAAQTVSALGYGKLKVNNPNGVTLAGATTVSSTLTLTDGEITTSGFAFTITGICPASVVPGSGYVNGAIRLSFPASATTTCTYPVGSSATAYTPINLAATTGAGGGTLTGSTTAAEHPQINTSDIDPARSANRYWTLWSAGDTINLTSYDITVNFVAADVDGGAVPANFILSKYAGAAWSSPTPVSATATTTAVTGIAGPLSATTNYAVGEGQALFIMSSPDGEVVIGGRPHRLRITRTKLDGVTVLTGYIGARNLDGWYGPGGSHPGAATAPQICAVNGSGTPCLPATGGSCVSLPNAAPALNAGVNNLSITFASGVADYCLATADVGQYTLSLRDDSNVSQPVTGTTATLTARPYAVVVSTIVQGATPNPASPGSATGSPFVAGVAFSATAGGYLWKSSGAGSAGYGDADGDGIPDASPSFADVVTNGGGIAPRYADTVTLATDTAAANFAPTAPPATQGTLSGGTAIIVAAGSATTATLKYSEVGSFTLTATPSGNYLGGGGDLAPRVVIFGDGATRNAWVGRFRPDHFVISAGASAAGCGSFTYFGQDGFTTAFTLTAENGDTVPATTTNYAGSWAKFGLTTWANYAFTAATLPAGSSFAASATAPSGTWTSGSASVSAKHQISRPTALTGATAITVSAQPTDSDGVTMATTSVGSANLRYGRLRLLAAYGSERLPLRVPVRAESFNGTAWTQNSVDSCTTIPQNAVKASAGISANVCFLSNPPPASPVNASCLAGGSPVLNLSNGTGTYVLFDKTPAQVGFADLAANLGSGATDTSCNAANPASAAGNLSWLQFPWCSGKLDPNARVKFGASKAPYIYLRERY
ncbi:MAG: hypothetical protein HZA62_02190 [Rhodocyclales bacterium]|nr:hypothetical protein [Rhodocyclales bacterium]